MATSGVNDQDETDTKPAVFVWAALAIADNVDLTAHGVNAFRSHKHLPQRVPSPPNLKEWLLLYRQHRKIMDLVGQQVFGGGEKFSATDALADYRVLLAMSPDERTKEISSWPAEVKKALSWFVGLINTRVPFPPSVEYIRDFQVQADAQCEVGDDGKSQFASAPMQFYFRIWMPCLISYRTYPPLLMRQARQGCMEALDKLLRLDKSVVADRLIAEHWHQAVHHHDKTKYQILMAAMKGQPNGRLTKRRVREGLAGQISQLALALGCPVTEPEIRELFDRISEARTGKKDFDLPDNNWAFSKAIQRNRTWPSLPPHPHSKPDKKQS